MPELPEVETVCKGLEEKILKKKIVSIEIKRFDLRWPIPFNLDRLLINSEVLLIKRRSKFILIEFSNKLTLILHLGMSGRIILHDKIKIKNKRENLVKFFKHYHIPDKHDHIIFHFENHKIIYNDVRRFGAIDVVSSEKVSEHKWLKFLGPEPLSDDLSLEYLYELFKRKSLNIKNAIMDQKNISGIGNIYACETLWLAGISPLKSVQKINKKKLEKLINSIKIVLVDAINAGGSSLKDFKNVSGEIGYFQNKFNVYSRDGLECKRNNCTEKIKKIKQCGRSTFFCPSCQNN